LSSRRTDVAFESGDDVCRGWFMLPEGTDASVSCIVMAHGFGLTRRCKLHEFAVAFTKAGYAVLLFDYRGFGDSGGQPRQVVSFGRQREDWQAAIDFARSKPEVNPSRVATWGFSLGAGHALSVAADDGAVAAVVAVAPMFDGLSSTLAAARRWSPLNFLRVVGRALRDLAGACFGRAPTMIRIAGNPGDLALLTSPDAYPGYKAIVPSDFDFDVAARIGLLFWTYCPGLRLRRFTRPILVLPSRIDKINPPGPTMRRARHCKSGSIVELDCEHMEVAVEPQRSLVIRATLEFLSGCLPSR
jgi:pimeloyl-ACP methyl ester carboxylesterase